VAEHGAGPAGQYGGERHCRRRSAGDAEGVDAAVQALETARGHATRDRAPGHAGAAKLVARQDAVLARSDHGSARVPASGSEMTRIAGARHPVIGLPASGSVMP